MGKDFVLQLNDVAQRISGKLCNSFSGKLITQKGNRIQVSDLVGTKMICPDMPYETVVFDALQKATNYSLEDGALEISQNGEPLLVLQKRPEPVDKGAAGPSAQNKGVGGQSWKFVSLNYDHSAIPLSELTTNIVLDSGAGKLAGQAPCNRFFGTLLLDSAQKGAGKIAFDNIGSTMMACPELATEQKMMKALSLVNNYEVKGANLFLMYDGQVLFELTGEAPKK